MPRINAATIAEHVAQQEAAVIEAARRLFDARGFRQVSLSDIAAEVGLGRTSLYRYFPTKAHLVQGWFEQAMTPLVERSRAAVDAPGTDAERLEAWLDVQLAFLLEDEHTALVAASLESEDLPDDVRERLGARHRELYATVSPLLAGPAGDDPALVRVRTVLVAGLVRSAADLVRAGADRAGVRAELGRSARLTAGLA
ncbi:MAG: TetR/AcrR family transcriptional regulator [Nocardioidaceae bacterium]|nr:TetR/AcrR family transcriptional regulator [Nocardioidaceae bacterium]